MPEQKSPRRPVNIPVVVEKLSGEPVEIDAALENLYERVLPDDEQVGVRHPGVIEELALNGAFVAGPVIPLTSRVALSFTLPRVGGVRAIGWVMWRRTARATVSSGNGRVEASAGIGVMFEHLPHAAARAILEML